MSVRRPLPLIGLTLAITCSLPPALADLELATKSGCTICHQIDTKTIGPAYKEVAARYKGDASALETLVVKVRDGGAGNWGELPMTPNAHVGEETIRKLVEWILSLDAGA